MQACFVCACVPDRHPTGAHHLVFINPTCNFPLKKFTRGGKRFSLNLNILQSFCELLKSILSLFFTKKRMLCVNSLKREKQIIYVFFVKINLFM